ncbi:MAG: hypothetical protein WBJ70_06625 [Bacilli bacterium]
MKAFLKFLFLFFVLVLAVRGASTLASPDENRYYYPEGSNYLDPDNFTSGGTGYYRFCSIGMFRVKPATTYCFCSLQPDLFQIGWYDFEFFDAAGRSVPEITTYEYRYQEGNIIAMVFETPASARFMIIEVETCPVGDGEVEEFAVDKYFALSEGEEAPEGDARYQGPGSFYPLTDVEEMRYYASYNDVIKVEDLLACLRAVDDVDGDITARIEISEDAYTENAAVVGVYPVRFSVSDKSGNTASLAVYISVCDWDAPAIFGPEAIDAEPDEFFSEDYLLGMLTARDDYDGDLSSAITVVRNDYAGNHDREGIYRVEFAVSDGSGNLATHIININVKDRTPPVITGPSEYRKPNNVVIPLNQILSEYRAADNVDGDITDWIEIVENNYSRNPNRVGSHAITLSASDSAGNETTFTLYVIVEDVTAPIFLIDVEKIAVTVTADGVILRDLIAQTANSDAGIIEVISDGYTGNEKTPGTYGALLKVGGKYYKLEVTVNGAEEPPRPKKKNLFKKIGDFFKKLWKGLRGLFKK